MNVQSVSNTILPPFHLAFPILDLQETERFYTEVLGCRVGRRSERWIDLDFFGHQITGHCVDSMPHVATNPVDGKQVPSSHFGAILSWNDWHALRDRLVEEDLDFLIGPYVRFEGEPGEQATMFITDPSGNGLEFKAFREPSSVFATQ